MVVNIRLFILDYKAIFFKFFILYCHLKIKSALLNFN